MYTCVLCDKTFTILSNKVEQYEETIEESTAGIEIESILIKRASKCKAFSGLYITFSTNLEDYQWDEFYFHC